MKRQDTLLLLAVLAIAGVCLAIPAKWLVDNLIWSYHQRKTHDLVNSLEHRRPSDVEPETWEAASGWTSNAYANICFSPDAVSLSELKRFTADLERELGKQVDLETTAWIWRRLAQTGPHGKQYVDRFEAAVQIDLDVAAERVRARKAESPSPFHNERRR